MLIRTLIAAPIAFALSALVLGVAAGPAAATTTEACDTAPAQLRGAAASAEPAAAKRALYHLATAEKLCAASAEREAGKKFAAAAKALGVDLAALPTTTASAQ